MSLNRPPPRIENAVELFAPGFWRAFFYHLTAAAQTAGARGVLATSWWRDKANNERVGGYQDSQHLLGTAVDLVGEDLREILADLTRRGFVVVNAGDHIHVQAWPAGLARSAGLLDYVGL